MIASAYMVGGAVVMGVALWLLRKHAGTGDAGMYRKATRFGAIFALVPRSASSSPVTSRARS